MTLDGFQRRGLTCPRYVPAGMLQSAGINRSAAYGTITRLIAAGWAEVVPPHRELAVTGVGQRYVARRRMWWLKRDPDLVRLVQAFEEPPVVSVSPPPAPPEMQTRPRTFGERWRDYWRWVATHDTPASPAPVARVSCPAQALARPVRRDAAPSVIAPGGPTRRFGAAGPAETICPRCRGFDVRSLGKGQLFCRCGHTWETYTSPSATSTR